jgi:hypothetical protein
MSGWTFGNGPLFLCWAFELGKTCRWGVGSRRFFLGVIQYKSGSVSIGLRTYSA